MMLPATRITNRSPNPWSKTSSGGTLESLHARIVANGCCDPFSIRPLATSFITSDEIQVGPGRAPRRQRWRGASHPSVVVDRRVAEHLEILSLTSAGCLRLGERVRHAYALDRLLCHAVDRGRLRQPDHIQERWSEVDDVVKLGAQFALRLDPLSPVLIPAWLVIMSSSRPRSPAANTVFRSSSRTALNGCVFSS